MKAFCYDWNMRVVGCFIKIDKEFLLLYRSSNSRDPNVWGLPSGKVDSNESDINAIIREVNEETGIALNPSDLNMLGEYEFITSLNEPSIFVAFEINFDKKPHIKLNTQEHMGHMWVTPEQAGIMKDLIHGQLELLQQVKYI
jgi:8-oxo-dGTP pyrophosphatase MutT (NUDIX family)